MEDIDSKRFSFGRYLEEDVYKADYGDGEIDEAIRTLAEKIRDYLKRYAPGVYVVSTGWCVWVMTPTEARKRRMSDATVSKNLVS